MSHSARMYKESSPRNLNDIKKPVREHLDRFDETFKKSMRSSVPLLNIITGYILRSKGKQIRPLFVFLTAEFCGGVSEKTYRAASLIELLHTATLVHDDVVDDSNQRRGFFSINALWKNKIAVLVGDFLLSKGLLLALDNDDIELLRIVSEATRQMSEGELLQIEKARRLDIEEDVYFEIIRKKTASLIASCCAAGSESAGADREITRLMHQFGEHTGMAFQIKDDIFDYQTSLKTGKPSGGDLKEKKLTLPLLHVLNQASDRDKRQIINTVKNHSTSAGRIMPIIHMVNERGGIDHARRVMFDYRDKALEILHAFPGSEARTALENLVKFTTDRDF